MEKSDLLITVSADRSAILFTEGLYCAESVLQAVAESHGLMNPAIPKIATGFCGGVSRTSGRCGALSGGIMALGLLTGRSRPEDDKRLCYTLSFHLVNRFREEFGATGCSELLGCDLSTTEGTERYKREGLEETICAGITRRTAALVEELFAAQSALRHPLL